MAKSFESDLQLKLESIIEKNIINNL